MRSEILSSQENFLNGEPTDMLACFDIKGTPQERVVYQNKEPVWRKIQNKNFLSSIKLTVTDEIGEVINFNGLPLLFQIEIE